MLNMFAVFLVLTEMTFSIKLGGKKQRKKKKLTINGITK